jgi:uncharacterized protein YjbJ (UPF0337 family)
MDWNRIEGNWKEAKGKIKQKWGQLTDDDLTQVNGRRDQLEGRIQQRYGLAKDMVRKDVDDWLNFPTVIRLRTTARRRRPVNALWPVVPCEQSGHVVYDHRRGQIPLHHPRRALITISNLTGFSTGRSAGMAPRIILWT